jgi:dipeptidyl aminopeptidase/acylaminoacyl peptidase
MDDDGAIYVLQPRTGIEQRFEVPQLSRPFAWMVDRGSLILLIGEPGNPYRSTVARLSLGDGALVELGHVADMHAPSGWAPDGTRVAFGSSGSALEGIVVLDLAAGVLIQITTDGGKETPVWSPDGTRLAYVAYDPARSQNDLYVVNADGSDRRRLTDDVFTYFPLAWSADGSRLRAWSDRDTPQNKDDYNTWEVELETGAFAAVANPSVNAPRLFPSPNGRWAALRTADYLLQLAPADGMRPVTIDRRISAHLALTWSPDGEWLLWARQVRPDGPVDLFAAQAADPGAEPINLTMSDVAEYYPVWGVTNDW